MDSIVSFFIRQDFPCFAPPVIYYKRYYDNAFSPILAAASDLTARNCGVKHCRRM